MRAALARGRSPDIVELRVAASVTQLGLVARLLAPTIATAVLEVTRAAIVPNEFWWQDQLGGPFPLSIALRERPPRRPHPGCHRIHHYRNCCGLWRAIANGLGKHRLSDQQRRADDHPQPTRFRPSRPRGGRRDSCRPTHRRRRPAIRPLLPTDQLLPDLPAQQHNLTRVWGLRPAPLTEPTHHRPPIRATTAPSLLIRTGRGPGQYSGRRWWVRPATRSAVRRPPPLGRR